MQRKIALLAKLEDEAAKGSIDFTLKNVTNQLNNSKQPSQDSAEPVASNSDINTNTKSSSESSTCTKPEIDTIENNENNEQPIGHNNLLVANENNGAAGSHEQHPLRESNSSDSINTITKTHRKQHSMSDESFQQQLERNAPNSSSGHRRAIKKTRVRTLVNKINTKIVKAEKAFFKSIFSYKNLFDEFKTIWFKQITTNNFINK